MDYRDTPNAFLEALCYLGARVNGFGETALEDRLRSKGMEDTSAFRERYAPFAAVLKKMDAEVPELEPEDAALFRDLPGFQYNTSGAFSSAFLLLFPVAPAYDGDLDRLLSLAAGRTPEDLARDLLLALDLWDNTAEASANTTEFFLNTVLAMTVPAESRLALLDAQRNGPRLIARAGQLLRPVIHAIRRQSSRLQALSQTFGRELEATGCETYLREITSLNVRKGAAYHIYPLILSPSTNLFLDRPQKDGSVVIYCGVLRKFLLHAVSDTQDSVAQLSDAFHLLADRTRLEILLYLRDHPAYGQELADQFGLARNTIHHHMSKLYNAGLVTCTVDGPRVYYALDLEHLRRLVERQCSLFFRNESEKPR